MKIVCLVNSPTSAVSMYRSKGVLPLIDGIEWAFVENGITWVDCVKSDILFLQRPCNVQDIDAIRMAKGCGMKIWIDCDDLDLQVPKSNPRHAIFSDLMVQNRIKSALQMADVVTTSTVALRDNYLQFNPNIVVIPNAINRNWMPRQKPQDQSKTVVWRGGPSHDEDLMEYGDAISRITYEYSSYEFVFMGNPAWHVLQKCNQDNVRVIQPQDTISYFQNLKMIAPKVVMVPLKDSEFNRCKSNIAWLEGSFAGAVVVAPDWHEWRHKGILNYKGHVSFENLVGYAIESTTNLCELSRDYIYENLTLSKANQMRCDVIRKLLES